jgi:iron(III) transport system substrate-binding protein
MLLSIVGCSNQSKDVNNDTSQDAKGTEQNNENNKSAEKILVYLSGPEAMLDKLEEEFEADRGDVADFQKMSCGQVRSKTWTEKEAGQIQADVIWGSDPLIYNKLDDEGLLEKADYSNFDVISPEHICKDRNYMLVNERYVTIMFNKDKLKKDQVPKSYDDLNNSEFKNKVVMANANHSSTALGIASALYQLKGNNMDYFVKLKENGLLLSKSNGQVPSKIMEGQFQLGIGPHDAVVRLKKKAKKEGYEMPVSIVWPEEGIISIQRPIAIIKNENRSEGKQKIANEFINFILSKKAQQITNNFGFVSVRKDIENQYLPENKEVHRIDWEKASKNEDQLKKEYNEIFQK